MVTSDFLPNFNVLSNYKLFTFIFKGRRNEREKEKASCFSPCFRMTDVVPVPQKKRKTSRRRRVQGHLCFSVRSKAEDTDGGLRTRLRPNGISIQKTTEQVLFSVWTSWLHKRRLLFSFFLFRRLSCHKNQKPFTPHEKSHRMRHEASASPLVDVQYHKNQKPTPQEKSHHEDTRRACYSKKRPAPQAKDSAIAKNATSITRCDVISHVLSNERIMSSFHFFLKNALEAELR